MKPPRTQRTHRPVLLYGLRWCRLCGVQLLTGRPAGACLPPGGPSSP